MNVAQVDHIWSVNSLLAKSQRYAETMLEQERDHWKFGFWSALTLELLARAALANISPTLIADLKDWNNIVYSLGHQPNVKKFTPKSASISEVLGRLESLLPEFTNEMLSFCLIHLNRRNTEVHSGELAFDGLGTSKWLGKFYHAAAPLLGSLNKDLVYLFGTDESKIAEELIQANRDESAKAVAGTIKAHQTVWSEKEPAECDTLKTQAETIASRKYGHRVKCPSCDTTAILHGSAIGETKQYLEEDIVVEKQTMLPSNFECFACGLKISGFSKLNSCGLGDSFTDTSHYDATEYFEIEPSDEQYFEPDFND